LRGKRIAKIEFRLHKSNFTFETLLIFRRRTDNEFCQYRLLLPWASVLREWISLVTQVNCPTGIDAIHLLSWLATYDIREVLADAGVYVPICQRLIENLVDSETKRIPKNELDRLRGFEGLPDSPDGVFLYLIRNDLRANEMEWVANCLDNVCEHTLFVLSSGHIGRVPYSTEDEDIVAWFAGAHRPIVIRPVGENYIVIGPAHIHRIKEGDVWEDKDDVTELELFTLQ
jgi:hypothetical protein